MPVIYKEKVEYAYTDPGVKAHTLSWDEYQALPTAQKMNGDLYFIPDKQPEGNPSRIWAKLGTEPLDTQAEDVSGAVNELNSSITILNNFVHITAIRTYTVSFGTINANTSGVGTVNITPPADDEYSIQFTRNATWCIPQIINLSSNRDQMTVQAINPSAAAHNCSATIIVIYCKNS